MKSLSMPVSSPSRAGAENFPPPLMRFLKSDLGSRSSGRPRASPLLRGKNNPVGVIETTQEPSSPKVTCFGQVSARRSANAKAKTTASHRPWWRHKKTLFCGKVSSRFGSWFLFCKSGYCKKVDAREDSFRANSNQKSQKNEKKNDNDAFAEKSDRSSCSSGNEVDGVKCENIRVGIQENKEEFVFCPPKNALILTRCRSAPYRSSSLAARIWGSPFEPTGTEAVKTEIEAKTEQESLPCPENAAEESRISPESSTKLETENTNTESNDQDLKGTEGGEAVRPLLLTRCKSEPARTVERLNPVSGDSKFE